MKSIKQIREQYDLITEKEENEERKLTTLVRSGLVDTNKLPLIKRALNKDNRVLTPSERNALMSLLDSLMAQVLSHNPVYQKVKQNVMTMNEELRPSTNRMSDMPSILVLKRRAIRVYPGGQNVGLYYSQQLDRFVAVPFGPREDKAILSMTEEVEQIDEISDQLRNATYAKRVTATRKARKDSADQALNLTKAFKTAVRVVAKKGMPAWAQMQRFADRYDDAERETQASVRVKMNRGKKAQSVNPLKKRKAKPEASNTTSGNPTNRNRERTPDDTHNEIMGSNAKKDFINSIGKERGLGDFVGRVAYRAMNKNVAEEQQLNENPVGALVIGAARQLGTAAAAKYGPKIGAAILKRLRGKKPKKRKQDVDVEVDAPENKSGNNNGGQSSRQSGGVKANVSPTGGPSRLRVTTSNAQREYRDRQQTLANMRNGNLQMQREAVELELDGNKFQLNSTVAKKVQTVYESLNKKNKKKMVDMMNESEESFNKVISFVVRH